MLPGERFDGQQGDEHPRLVIAGATRVDLALPDGRLEWRRLPQIERVWRLHIVMRVDQRSRFAVVHVPSAVDQWMSTRFENLHLGDPRRFHACSNPFGCGTHVDCIGWKCADTRNPQEVVKLFEVVLFLLGEIGAPIDPGHGSPLWFETNVVQRKRAGARAPARFSCQRSWLRMICRMNCNPMIAMIGEKSNP